VKSDLRRNWVKVISIAVGLVLAAFIIALLLLVVTHPDPAAIVTSLQTKEIQFAIYLSLATSIVSTLLCILIAVPAAYALARYDFWGKSFVSTILDMPLALPPLVAGVGLLLLFGTNCGVKLPSRSRGVSNSMSPN